MATDSKKRVWQFGLESIADLKQLAAELGVAIEANEDVSILAQPVQVDGLSLPNSLAVHPMEGTDGDSAGRPAELTFRRYKRFARGGAGLLWVEATAVGSRRQGQFTAAVAQQREQR